MALVREHFQKAASSFDSLYDETSPIQRTLRPAIFDRMDAAVRLVRARRDPRVLDVGCGSCRVGEALIEAGASRYTGVDFSQPMIDLARRRLERYEGRVELITGDFISAPLTGPFDVIVAVGFFDYIAEPDAFVRRIFGLCAEGAVAFSSFPRWTWHKGPIRHVRYEWINRCPIYDYTERELGFLFRAAGFSRVDIDKRSDGFFVSAFR